MKYVRISDPKERGFLLGFKAVQDGVVRRELTLAEIEAAKIPNISSEAFAQGVIDALAKDYSRFNLLNEKYLYKALKGMLS